MFLSGQSTFFLPFSSFRLKERVLTFAVFLFLYFFIFIFYPLFCTKLPIFANTAFSSVRFIAHGSTCVTLLRHYCIHMTIF